MDEFETSDGVKYYVIRKIKDENLSVQDRLAMRIYLRRFRLLVIILWTAMISFIILSLWRAL